MTNDEHLNAWITLKQADDEIFIIEQGEEEDTINVIAQVMTEDIADPMFNAKLLANAPAMRNGMIAAIHALRSTVLFLRKAGADAGDVKELYELIDKLNDILNAEDIVDVKKIKETQ